MTIPEDFKTRLKIAKSKIKKQIEDFYKKKGTKRPQYQGNIPEGNNQLGLFLLGITGDKSKAEILKASPATYNILPALTLSTFTIFHGAFISKYLLTLRTKCIISSIASLIFINSIFLFTFFSYDRNLE